MAHGLEARVPFLDKAFLDVAMLIETKKNNPRPMTVLRNTSCAKLSM
jgi:asparagine synthetase B (glutamine-hydrolysing)